LKKIILVIVAAIILFGGFTVYSINNSKRNNITSQKKVTLSKKSAKKINAKFYSHEKVQAASESALVNYPSTFSGLVDSGDLTVTGEVINLKSFVYEGHPYTIASLIVSNILKGDQKLLNKTIRVMFVGGNISKKEMLRSVPNNSTDGTDSDEIVTVEYDNNRLPRAGDKVALILSKAPAGANKIPRKFWGINFASKGIFFKDADGKYRRIPEKPSIGGGKSSGTSNVSFNAADDKKMNNGMNDLIKGKKASTSN